MRFLVRFMGFLPPEPFCSWSDAAAGLIWHYSKDLPDYSQPRIMSV